MNSSTDGTPVNGSISTHFWVNDTHLCDGDDRPSISDSQTMTRKTLIDTACELTGLSGTKFAEAAGIPQSTLNRLQNGGNEPRLDTIRKMSAAVAAHSRGHPNGAAIRQEWHRAVCAETAIDHDTGLDLSILETVITQARRDLRHVWSDLPADKIAQAITGAYTEVIAADRAADRDA